jgi:hypothetical protein
MSPRQRVWVRFWPWYAKTLLKQSNVEYASRLDKGEEGLYAISVWGAVGPEATRSLIDGSEMGDKEWVAVVPAEELEDFEIRETPDVVDHFDLVLGTERLDSASHRLGTIFESHRRRNEG